MSSKRSSSSKQHEEKSESFGIIDLIRIIGGIILLNAFSSWWFTSSATWGYKGKWIDPRYVKFRVTNGYVNLTSDELALYNGTDASLPIYIGINGKVYDVSNSRSIYGPKGSYAFFSGKDSARAFVTGCFQKADEFTHDLRGLDPVEAENDISGWQKYYEDSDKYWYVGVVRHGELTDSPPEPCDHTKFPGYHAHGQH